MVEAKSHGVSLVPYRSAGWSGLVNSAWSDELVGVDPMTWSTQHRSVPVPDVPDSRTQRIRHPRRTLYMKRLVLPDDEAPGTLVAARRWMRRIVGGSPTLNAARVCDKLRAAGLSAPVVVLAAKRRTGLRTEHVLVTEAVAGKNFRLLFKRAPEDASRAALIERVAREVRRLHDAGFVHGDLLPANLVVDPDANAVVFIDNERTRFVGSPSWRARRRNLEQVAFRLLRMAPYRATRRFIAAYFGSRKLTETTHRRLACRILNRVRGRIARESVDRFDRERN